MRQETIDSLNVALDQMLSTIVIIGLAFGITIALMFIVSARRKGENGQAFILGLTVMLVLAHIVRGLLA